MSKILQLLTQESPNLATTSATWFASLTLCLVLKKGGGKIGRGEKGGERIGFPLFGSHAKSK